MKLFSVEWPVSGRAASNRWIDINKIDFMRRMLHRSQSKLLRIEWKGGGRGLCVNNPMQDKVTR